MQALKESARNLYMYLHFNKKAIFLIWTLKGYSFFTFPNKSIKIELSRTAFEWKVKIKRKFLLTNKSYIDIADTPHLWVNTIKHSNCCYIINRILTLYVCIIEILEVIDSFSTWKHSFVRPQSLYLPINSHAESISVSTKLFDMKRVDTIPNEKQFKLWLSLCSTTMNKESC